MSFLRGSNSSSRSPTLVSRARHRSPVSGRNFLPNSKVSTTDSPGGHRCSPGSLRVSIPGAGVGSSNSNLLRRSLNRPRNREVCSLASNSLNPVFSSRSNPYRVHNRPLANPLPHNRPSGG